MEKGNYYEVTVLYERMSEDEFIKPVKEKYLVETPLATDAQDKVLAEINPFISGDVIVDKIIARNIERVMMGDEGGKLYKIKVSFLETHDNSGKEKTTTLTYIVQAYSLIQAASELEEYVNESLCECDIISAVDAKIVDYLPYE